MNPQIRCIRDRILDELPAAGTLDRAVDIVRERFRARGAPQDEEILQKARQAAENQLRSEVEYIRPRANSLYEYEQWQNWYLGPREGDRFWPRYRAYLLESKGWREEDINALDAASSEIVSLLGNPREERFQIRGLVVGHVQSGKTANMMAVIAKAADAGYNCFVILAGLTNKLRHQTQTRIYTDLVGWNPAMWDVLSPEGPEEDFLLNMAGELAPPQDHKYLLVIKKNRAPMDSFLRAIRGTKPVDLWRLKVLLIDDECDQASVNAARQDGRMTAINRRIREMLQLLPAVSYVGYTATPFANVLINPYPEAEGVLDDLYPKDFITSLPTPPRYFGAARLFGRTPDDPANPKPEEEGLDVIRDVPEQDELKLQSRQPGNANVNAFHPEMPESLQDAILYFLACCAVRRARGHADRHMTMLVHTSQRVALHEAVATLIRGWLQAHCDEILNSASGLCRRMRTIWADEQERAPQELRHPRSVTFEEWYARLPDVLAALEVAVENGVSEDRIDYSGHPKTYIVVGGTVLSRGLTLEGLMVSYFLRSANQYDTLLQMGRWFGFRDGYEDLPRIWTTEKLKANFRALAGIEEEIRAEIRKYREYKLTPMDAAVRIRRIPGMAVTAANKMRHAIECGISFWGTHRQTFRFDHRNLEILKQNWQAGARLVDALEQAGLRDPDSGAPVWRNADKDQVVDFLEQYQPHATHMDLSREVLARFVEDSMDRRLQSWNVALVQPDKGSLSEAPLGSLGRVRTVRRARLRGDQSFADIKALMSRRDLLIDCPPPEQRAGELNNADWERSKEWRRTQAGDKPLLLLYAIDRISEPMRANGARVPLDAIHDVLGYGIVFPGSTTEGGGWISVQLRPVLVEDEAAAEEEAQELLQAAEAE